MSRFPRNPAEQAMFDAGYAEAIKLVADLATRTATSIETSSKRAQHEGFAVAALRELADGIVTLIVSNPQTPADGQRRAA